MMKAPTDILKFQGVSITVDSAHGSGIGNLSLSLAAGDLALVFAQKEQVRILWADAAEGLVAPAQGTVSFLGEDWRTMTANHAAQQRGKIGRVFEGECWRSDLYVAQNITVGRQLNTRHALEEIEEEAIELRRDFGLPELPRGRPARLRWKDLLMAACVRAFVGAPDLVLLENPRSGHAEGMVPLLKAVHAARRRGAAILWMTDELRVWNHRELRATTRCRMSGSQVQVVDEADTTSEMTPSEGTRPTSRRTEPHHHARARGWTNWSGAWTTWPPTSSFPGIAGHGRNRTGLAKIAHPKFGWLQQRHMAVVKHAVHPAGVPRGIMAMTQQFDQRESADFPSGHAGMVQKDLNKSTGEFV